MNYKIVFIIAAVGFIGGWQAASQRCSNTTAKTTTEETSHTKTITKTVKQPDGTITIISTIDERAKSNTVASLPVPRKKTNVSVLMSNDFSARFKPVYGISVQRELLGPITVGVFGLTNSTVGVSIGINF
jgi:hypothetical protein